MAAARPSCHAKRPLSPYIEAEHEGRRAPILDRDDQRIRTRPGLDPAGRLGWRRHIRRGEAAIGVEPLRGRLYPDGDAGRGRIAVNCDRHVNHTSILAD
jgi:hypothetical protein